MKRSIVTLAAVVFTLSLTSSARADTWKDVPLMDTHCSEKMAKTPDEHPRACALQCAKGGYGLITADGKYLPFDEEGNKKALAALKKSEKKNHLRATVEGTVNDGVLSVASLSLQ